MTKKNRAKARRALLTLSLVLVVAFAAVGGTLAWLTDTTEEVVNTFTPSFIDIELDENTEEYPMIPGETIEKDPYITITETSEDAWIFVKIVKSEDYDEYLEDYEVTEEWTLVPGTETETERVYYMAVDKGTKTEEIYVLADNQIKVLTTVTNAMMASVESGDANVELTFTAYAIQQAGFESKDDIAATWEEAKKAQIYPAPAA